MVTVKCDMCGKDILNDDGRTTFSFPKEDCFVCYDVCRDCANKVEEFIKVSYKHSCEPLNPEDQEALDKMTREEQDILNEDKVEKEYNEALKGIKTYAEKKDPCAGLTCYEEKEDGVYYRCAECTHTYNVAECYHYYECAKKGTGVAIPDKDIVDGLLIEPGAFNGEEF